MSVFGKKDSDEAKRLEEQKRLDEEKASRDLHGSGVTKDARSAEVLTSEASSARIGRDRPIEASASYKEAEASAVVHTGPAATPFQKPAEEDHALVEKVHADGEEGARLTEETFEANQKDKNKPRKK